MTAQVETLPVVRDGHMGALLMIDGAVAWVPVDDLRAMWAKTMQAQTDRALDEQEQEG